MPKTDEIELYTEYCLLSLELTIFITQSTKIAKKKTTQEYIAEKKILLPTCAPVNKMRHYLRNAVYVNALGT